uniref:Transposase n=1 Tax=Ignisphaera aggregans TaxID=334771 RepID=A0A7J2U2G9_9CREN
MRRWLKVRESSLKTLEQVRMYSIPISDPRIRELITWYLRTLQKAIDIIWENIDWRYRFPRIERRKRRQVVIIPSKFKVPELPKSKSFKRKLRDDLLQNCPYARHWVDAVIRTAYSIMESWRKRYLKGGARRVKPRVEKRFARCKITLMKVDYREKRIRITIKPGEYIEVSWSSRWFAKRVKGWRVGEVVLKDDRVLIPFKSTRIIKVRGVVAWDSNELSLDGFSPDIGFIRVDLKPLQSMKIVYEMKKRVAQSKGLKEIYEKYVARERNRERDFVNKLVNGLTRLFPNTIHVFENLEKDDLISKKRVRKSRRKRNARTPWKIIQKKISERTVVVKVSPKNTSRTCPQCGCVVKTQVGRLFKCPRCGFELDRQKLASINIYLKHLRMRGLPHSNDLEKAVKGELWVGVTPSGWSPMIWIPVKGILRAVKPRVESLVSNNIKLYENQTPSPKIIFYT